MTDRRIRYLNLIYSIKSDRIGPVHNMSCVGLAPFSASGRMAYLDKSALSKKCPTEVPSKMELFLYGDFDFNRERKPHSCVRHSSFRKGQTSERTLPDRELDQILSQVGGRIPTFSTFYQEPNRSTSLRGLICRDACHQIYLYFSEKDLYKVLRNI
ncbi:Uncharacterised protein [Serratia fonticola]|nr:Uncharacterised protein [Serratia fonticola]CAI1926243.1 Uncharacterised protein [Serratia fonticola]CAI2010920.1 Uncharacterised protein [Serratia fonticola]CAI2533103.1 Uncharacterised protein [Serratia fonticola]